ncbi:MAG: pitrilysin family protein [Anaerolineales bacterium]|jgi:predicted Zn-dependent peptidase
MQLHARPESSEFHHDFCDAASISASLAIRAADIGPRNLLEGREDFTVALETRPSQYQRTTLENGIRVVSETIPGSRSVAIGILIDASPRDEKPEKAGLAHLTEHLLFQGTSSRDENQIANLMDVGGGNFGGFATRDYTCYFATVLDDYRTYAIDLLGDILLNSIFPPENVEREKTIILREIDRVRDTPYERAHMLLKSAVWPDHPLGRAITGDSTTVRGLTREDVIYFVHNHYLPDRMIIAAAGNLEHKDFVAQVRDAFWRLQGAGQIRAVDVPSFRSGKKIEHASVSQVYFSLGIQTLPYASADRYSIHLINNILGGGISSRLYRSIREERGLVYHIDSEYHAYRDAGLLVIEGSTAPENLMQVLAMTLVETGQLFFGDKPVDAEELWKAKMYLRGQHLLAGENTNTRMSRLATQEFYFGEHIPSDEILARIDSPDHHDLQRFANETFADVFGKAMIAIVGPGDTQHYSSSSINDMLADFR